MNNLRVLLFLIMAGTSLLMTSCEKDVVPELYEQDKLTNEIQTPLEQNKSSILLQSENGKNYGISFNQKVEEGDIPSCIKELIAQNYPEVIVKDVEAFIEEVTNMTFFEIELEGEAIEDFEIYCMQSPQECMELVELGVDFISENCLITTGCGDEFVVGENFDFEVQTVNGETTYAITHGEGEKISFNCDIPGFDVECEDADLYEDLEDFELPDLPDFELPELPGFELPDFSDFELPTSVIVTACGDSLKLSLGDSFDLDFDGDKYIFSLTHFGGDITKVICESGEYDVEVDKPDFDFDSWLDFDLDSLNIDLSDELGGLLGGLGGLDGILDGFGDGFGGFDGLGNFDGFGGLDGNEGLEQLGDIEEQNGLDGLEEIVNEIIIENLENCVFTTSCGDEIVFDSKTKFDFDYKEGTFTYTLTDENGEVTSYVCDKAGYEVDCN